MKTQHSICALRVIAILSFILLAFFSYAASQVVQDQNKNTKITLNVSGMTCISCEMHIEGEIKKLPGVSSVVASYEKGSTTVEFDEKKISAEKISATINMIGYKVERIPNLVTLQEKAGNCCTSGTCSNHASMLPTEENKNLKVISNVAEIQKAFNEQPGKIKFVAILSSTCGWCLQGAESIQKTVLEKVKDKNISVMIIWTNMLKTDDKSSAYKAASLFKDPNIVQFFDAKNKFGDVVAQRLNPNGKKAWDIYMFFDNDIQWSKEFPRPFEYAHQLSSSLHPWADTTKYFCGADLTKRLDEITQSL